MQYLGTVFAVIYLKKAVHMKSTLVLPLICVLFLMQSTLFAGDGRQAIYNYIDQYQEIAIVEMERTGIPASIKMAQAILESNAGRSELAMRANNHFGIKCGNDWTGGTHYRKDDDRDSRGRLIESCFRAYADAEESFIAHSEFLAGPSRSQRYGWLFELDPKDYKAWAHGLQKSGYATNRRYGQLLINVVENYNLHELDTQSRPLASAGDRKSEPEKATRTESKREGDFFQRDHRQRERREFEINQLKVVKAQAGETLADIALELKLPIRALLRFNDDIEDGFIAFAEDRNVFLQPKRRNYRGDRRVHRVSEGESMLDISLRYGLRLDRLYNRNRMDEGREPATGETIYLRGRRNRNESIRYRAPERKQERKIEEKKEPAYRDDLPSVVESPIAKSREAVPDTSDEHAGSESLAASSDIPNEKTHQKEHAESLNDMTSHDRVTHEVKAGETLFAISRKYGLSVAEIVEKNGIQDNLISIGQVLIIQ